MVMQARHMNRSLRCCFVLSRHHDIEANGKTQAGGGASNSFHLSCSTAGCVHFGSESGWSCSVLNCRCLIEEWRSGAVLEKNSFEIRNWLAKKKPSDLLAPVSLYLFRLLRAPLCSQQIFPMSSSFSYVGGVVDYDVWSSASLHFSHHKLPPPLTS
jgi:hypothetical protein